MRDKKIRGLKRNLRNMVNVITIETLKFPAKFYRGSWYLHLPIAQDFISSSKTPVGIKQKCIEILLYRAEHLMKLKPKTSEKIRVVVAIVLPGLWNAQI